MSEHYSGLLKLAEQCPWTVDHEDGHDSTTQSIATETGRTVVLVVNDDTRRPMAMHEAELDANARRLVACWNACEGLPTDFIEGRRFADLEIVMDVQRQRDDLLAALEHLVTVTAPDVNGQIGAQEEHAAALANATALIAAAKAGAA